MSVIERAVLLAAGRGTRLGALTATTPKPMLQVGGKPILHRILGGLADGGIRQVVVVTGHAAEVLEEATGDGSLWGLRIQYARQLLPEGTARAVSLARDFAAAEPFFVGWGDIVVDAGNYAKVIEGARSSGGALGVNEVEDPAHGAAVYFDEQSRIQRIVEKPAPGTSSTRWNNAGLMVLPPEIWRHIDALQPSPRGEYELPEAVANLIAEGHDIRAVPLSGPWFDIGTPESLQAARAHFGE